MHGYGRKFYRNIITFLCNNLLTDIYYNYIDEIMNYLYLGDCLNVLRENIKDESVDLIYIDPPFNSKRDYNIFFDDKEIHTQRIAFEDTWTLKSIQDSLGELNTMKTEQLFYLLLTYQKVAPHAFPYLVMMSLRLIELHRVLKPTGSFYLHCDPAMSHYLKTCCDIIFSPRNYKNEIIWHYGQRIDFHKGHFSRKHDVILFYSKNEEGIFNNISQVWDKEDFIEHRHDVKIDDDGREFIWTDGGKKGVRYKRFVEDVLKEGKPFDDVWDLPILNSAAKERLGYPTQKPRALLERIIQASSNEGDVVLDGFCGCGTTVDAAEHLHRQWIGIDISPIAISLIKRRLRDTYAKQLNPFEVRGIPADEQSAIELWKQNPNAFQDWWLTEFEVFSTTFGTKGADKGVDGIGQYLVDQKGNETIKAAFQVKGGTHIQSKDIDALLGAMEKHKCQLGVFLTIENPTKPMLETVAASGFIDVPGYKYPRLQILTLKDYFMNKFLKLPAVNVTFKAATKKGKKQHQEELNF
jgi:site-specific DNA-methyltransferase (adenine-specific)